MAREKINVSLGNSNVVHVENLHNDCKKLQYLRENAQNAIESLQREPDRIGYKKEVSVFVATHKGVDKLAFADNGGSMTRVEAKENLCGLGQGAAADGVNNFGVGALISSLPLNQYGVLYICYPKDESPHAMLMSKSKTKGIVNYDGNPMGLKAALGMLDDTPDLRRELGMIKKAGHGTLVILLGNFAKQNTADWNKELNEEGGSDGDDEKRERGAQWVAYYFNKRYYEIPKGIKLYVRAKQWRNKKRHNAQAIKGQRFVLEASEKYIEKSGSKIFTDKITGRKERIKWGTMKKNKPDSHGSSFNISGGISIINNKTKEVYSYRTGVEWRTVAQKYGIYHSSGFIIIHIFLNDIVSDISRSGLREKDGRPIDLDMFADDFRSRMPTKIQDFLRKKRSGKDKFNIRQNANNHAERICEIINTFNLDLCQARSRPTSKKGKGQLAIGERSPKKNDSAPSDVVDTGATRKSKTSVIGASTKARNKVKAKGFEMPIVGFEAEESQKYFATYIANTDRSFTGEFIVNPANKVWARWFDGLSAEYPTAKSDKVNAAIEDEVVSILTEATLFAVAAVEENVSGHKLLFHMKEASLSDRDLWSTLALAARTHYDRMKARLASKMRAECGIA